MRAVLLFLFLLSVEFVYSQTVVIRVIDQESATTLPGAHIGVFNLSKHPIKTLVTNTSGEVEIHKKDFHPLDSIMLICHYIGYETDTQVVDFRSSKVDFQLKQSSVYLGEMVVTGQHSANSAEKSVHTIKVIDRKKIESMQAVNLRDVLTNEMNIQLSQDNVLGSGMSMQGISGQNVKIMIDGVPVIGRLDGNIDVSQINLNDVERIEIVEGPMAVNYGTDALAGTINIITKKTIDHKVQANVNTYAEQVGTFNTTANIGLKHKKHTLLLSGGRNYFDGWTSGDGKWFNYFEKGIADSSRVSDWNPKEQYFGRLNWNMNFKKIQVQLQSGYFYEKITNKGAPRSPRYISAFDDKYQTHRIDQSVNFHQTKKRLEWNVLAGYNYFRRHKNTYITDLTTLNQELSSTSSDQDTSTFQQAMSRGNFVYQVNKEKLSVELGYDVNYQFAEGVRIENGKQDMGDYALFATAEWKPIENLTLKPGVRVTYNTAYDAPVTPSVNALYRIGKFSIRGSFAQGFRAPDLKELYFMFVDVNHNIQGNQDLKAEYSNNFNASVHYQTIVKQMIIRGEISGFYNQIEDRITLAQASESSSLYHYINVGNYQTHGGKIKGSLMLEHLKLQLGFNYVGTQNTVSDDYDNVDPYSYFPEVQSSVNYQLPKAKMEFSVFYKYTGKQQGYSVTDDVVSTTSIDSYNMLDATVGKQIIPDLLKISAGVKNILDVQNINSSASTGGAHSSSTGSLPIAMGRIYFINVSFSWKK